jgi:lipoprotein-anchoring transpeptidase ErfK/SrfK
LLCNFPRASLFYDRYRVIQLRLVIVMRHVSRLVALVGIIVTLTVMATPPAQARGEMVTVNGGAPGTIIVRTGERRLYYILGNNRALRFPVGVGRRGKQWTGESRIDGKYIKPAWAPTDDIRRDNPRLPDVIRGGSPSNPMGAAALTLSGGGDYAIHGTNRPGSIGGFVSYGCIRMHNADIIELYERVHVGTPVIVTQ